MIDVDHFKKLEAPFQFHSRILRLGESRAVGPAIGFTLEGLVDQNRDMVDLSGTIVPAYTINKFLAGVPLIGTILAGGDSEGIFAFTYKVKGTVSEPLMEVNPLSGLAPGLLRKIASGDSSERYDREAAAAAEAAKADKADKTPATDDQVSEGQTDGQASEEPSPEDQTLEEEPKPAD